VIELACFLINARTDAQAQLSQQEQQKNLKEEIGNLDFLLNSAFELLKTQLHQGPVVGSIPSRRKTSK